jgi:hypothetical protein
MTQEEIESALQADNDRKRARLAYYNALMMVKRLDHEYGADALARMLVAMGEGSGADGASLSVFELPYDELVANARAWTPLKLPAPEESQ